MMNETYESIRPDKGFRFMSEKVCHHPLTIAAHAESENYTYWQCTKVKSKFWGKSMVNNNNIDNNNVISDLFFFFSDLGIYH